jgi:hypothetical protein
MRCGFWFMSDGVILTEGPRFVGRQGDAKTIRSAEQRTDFMHYEQDTELVLIVRNRLLCRWDSERPKAPRKHKDASRGFLCSRFCFSLKTRSYKLCNKTYSVLSFWHLLRKCHVSRKEGDISVTFDQTSKWTLRVPVQCGYMYEIDTSQQNQKALGNVHCLNILWSHIAWGMRSDSQWIKTNERATRCLRA